MCPEDVWKEGVGCVPRVHERGGVGCVPKDVWKGRGWVCPKGV